MCIYIYVWYKYIIYKYGVRVQIVKASRKIYLESPLREEVKLLLITWTKQVERRFPKHKQVFLSIAKSHRARQSHLLLWMLSLWVSHPEWSSWKAGLQLLSEVCVCRCQPAVPTQREMQLSSWASDGNQNGPILQLPCLGASRHQPPRALAGKNSWIYTTVAGECFVHT